MKLIFTLIFSLTALASSADRPNILWITAEDHGPHLGCYGDSYATTPHIDALASMSQLYTRASSNAPVCAPARTTLITGIYPTTLGAQNMRSKLPIADELKTYPELLRAAGYYCTNQSKEDYNLILNRKIWDDSSRKAHWKNRPLGKPFFAIFNTTASHESQIRNANASTKHDSNKAPIPPYHPDTPEVRKDWAQYYDRLTLVDKYVKKQLDALKKAGLENDTIIFFYADHGSGMPRHKRYPGWSGLHVPLIVHIPEKWQAYADSNYLAGGKSDDLVSFVDFAPSLCSLASITPPSYQHGTAFLGPHKLKSRQYSFGFRGRMDERIDFCRSVTDGRYIYIRNFMPYLPHGQDLSYQLATPTTRVWRDLAKSNKLNKVQSAFWSPHPAEELYDLQGDPHETINLAKQPAHLDRILKFRQTLSQHMLATRDSGFMPEVFTHPLLAEQNTDLVTALAEESNYPLSQLVKLVTPGWIPEPTTPLAQFWKLQHFLSRGKSVTDEQKRWIQQASQHSHPGVQIPAHEWLCLYGEKQKSSVNQLIALISSPKSDNASQLTALNALYRIQQRGIQVKLPQSVPSKRSLYIDYKYVERLVESLR